ncbi:MAG: HAMP domain-containing histidine kinase [Clostridiales bacterium]|jgi:signal transduction histidine kinase|nr:HAMP domain-containing histidine kinase [Clostridiales bacterium]
MKDQDYPPGLLDRLANRVKRRMRSAANMTIGAKISFMYASIFAVGLISVTVFIMCNMIYTYRKYSRKELDQTAEKVAEYIESGGIIADKALKELNPNKYVEIGITQVSGESKDIWASGLPFPFSQEDYQTFEPKSDQMVEIRSVLYMVGERRANYEGKTYIVRVFRNYQRELEIINLFTMVFVSFNITGIALAAAVGKTISHMTLRPIRRLIQTAERISIEDLSQRIEVTGPNDEIRELSATFNDMIARLEISFRQQNQFIADASHELRTPISVIQGYANLIDRWGKNDPAVLQESIDSIKAETEHMSMLVKKLLFMAKTDQNKIQIQKQPLYLGYIAEEAVREMSVMELGCKITVNTDGTGLILGDGDLIKQLIWIFLENAVKYSKSPESEVVLSITDEKSKCRVSIKDYGIGIRKEDLPYIFERFYRADKSRSNEVPGSGLGLSIASWIAKQHGAQIDIKSEYGEGTEVIILFTRFTDEDLAKSSQEAQNSEGKRNQQPSSKAAGV